MYVGHVVELPGCVSQGRTPEEALDALSDALDVYLGALIERARPRWLEQALRQGSPSRRNGGKLQVELVSV